MEYRKVSGAREFTQIADNRPQSKSNLGQIAMPEKIFAPKTG